MTEPSVAAAPRPAGPAAGAGTLGRRFAAFVIEQLPFARTVALEAMAAAVADVAPASGRGVDELESLRPALRRELERRVARDGVPPGLETLPGSSASARLAAAAAALIEACDGFLRREAIAASLTSAERREALRGMILTRAVDNRLKALFQGAEMRYGGSGFQGKGYRSLGQEAVYAACLRLRRGDAWSDPERGWRGDVVAPLIRDLGAALAMQPTPEMVRSVLNAQVGKAGPPMAGRDFHIGDIAHGVLPPAAPLSIAPLTVAGVACAMAREGHRRVALAFIGEGGTSLGEWHEAINVCAVRRWPAIFCVENNQTALSTPVPEQSAARRFADKAAGYGIPGLSVDGTDPEAIAAAFAWAAERARGGLGPTLLELVCMRMCGHAHHDDMLYLGREPALGWRYPEPPQDGSGYVDREAYAFWAARDPIPAYAARLRAAGVIAEGDVEGWQAEAEEAVEKEVRALREAPWPAAETVGDGVVGDGPPARRVEPLDVRAGAEAASAGLPALDPGPPYDPEGRTFLDAVMLGVGDALDADERVFVFGQDVGGTYGNAFLLLRPLLARHGERIVNAPLAEGAILGVCTGAAIAGLRPIGEIQFNDFVATGFNQLVNNAAKVRYRWGASVPMVVRMPWGGLRRAGPYHSQNTEAWFYRVPGLKIIAPSTPADARALLAAAVADPDPVLFYEHIALYRDPRIRQRLDKEPPAPLPLGNAALRRAGTDLAIVSYGAYVHRALRVAEKLAEEDGIEAAVLDLRSLVPLDREALLRVACHCGRVLIVHEDTRRGSIGESLAAIIQEDAFEYLDAPVRVLAALDTPVPYSPPLEDAFLPSDADLHQAARLLVAY